MRTDPDLVAHLYRRAGFTATQDQVAELSAQPWNSLVDDLVAGLAGPDPAGSRVPLPHLTSIPEANVPGYHWDSYQEWQDLIGWWLQRMMVTDTPLREKLTLLLHCQFPTSIEKVQYASLMHTQNQIFRSLGPGAYDRLTLAVAEDPAMLIWLDTDTSHLDDPNQNFARELMERFTLGVGHYSQEDVIQASRCFTGWSLDQETGRFFLNRYDHDSGVKHVLGHRGRFSGQQLIELVTHQPASHRWVVSRLWSWLAFPLPPGSRLLDELVRSYATDLDMTALVAGILNHPAFQSPTARQGLVKQPVEYVVGAMRLLGLDFGALPKGTLQWYLSLFGQNLFAPPSVGGWGWNGYWLTTGSSLAHLDFASQLASVADLTPIENANGRPAHQVALVREMLGLRHLSAATEGALLHLGNEMRQDGGSWPAQQLVTLALVSPEFLQN